jgi:carboxypeptidase C (cathepsin A)
MIRKMTLLPRNGKGGRMKDRRFLIHRFSILLWIMVFTWAISSLVSAAEKGISADLTSYFATKYTVNSMNLVPGVKDNITLAFYDSGHQMYAYFPSLKKLRSDVAAFIQGALPSHNNY